MNVPTFKTGLLIAPCGMNCGICIGYLREKNKCAGCNIESENKPKYCRKCIIKNCENLLTSQSGFCFECYEYPCRRLKQLDKRYRTKYRMSMIENLDNIKTSGIEEFLNQENQKWACPICGARISAHRVNCLECGESIV